MASIILSVQHLLLKILCTCAFKAEITRDYNHSDFGKLKNVQHFAWGGGESVSLNSLNYYEYNLSHNSLPCSVYTYIYCKAVRNCVTGVKYVHYLYYFPFRIIGRKVSVFGIFIK